MKNAIVAAIKEKRLISFEYKGYSRIVEPHVYGINDGAEQILGYQTGGGSKTGSIPEWRRFDVSLMQKLQPLTNTFPGPRSFPSGKHSSWDQKIAIVE